jgi:phosphopantetheinyl transferase
MEKTRILLTDLEEIGGCLEPDDIIRLAQSVSDERRERILRYRQAGDRVRSLFGGLLVRYALRDAGCRNLRFCRNRYGKPYLMRNRAIRFSLSHAGRFVAVSVFSQDTGIDIEQNQAGLEKFCGQFLSEGEKRWVRQIQNPLRESALLRAWTAKESYLKWKGTGLFEDPGNVEFDYRDPGHPRSVREEVQMYSENLKEGYCLTVCASGRIRETIDRISVNTLKQFAKEERERVEDTHTIYFK